MLPSHERDNILLAHKKGGNVYGLLMPWTLVVRQARGSYTPHAQKGRQMSRQEFHKLSCASIMSPKKPEMERKRRQRINNCLSQIKRLIPEARELEVGAVCVSELAVTLVKDHAEFSLSVLLIHWTHCFSYPFMYFNLNVCIFRSILNSFIGL